MTIILNGEPFSVDDIAPSESVRPPDATSVTITDLLTHLDIDPRRVAVERNFLVVKRAAYDSTRIIDGDEIEIVNFVGGG